MWKTLIIKSIDTKKKSSVEFVFVSSASCLASLKLALWVCCNHWAEKKRHGFCLFVCHHGVEQDLRVECTTFFSAFILFSLIPHKFSSMLPIWFLTLLKNKDLYITCEYQLAKCVSWFLKWIVIKISYMCNFKCFACVPPPMGERARVMLLWGHPSRSPRSGLLSGL